ncbi:MAG TPA: NAD(P)H-dependent oxidoreductase [Spongiibacteraceae bacterium]|nr:NAD(P)H-dependent oxidoreductase [Spongiibacteraceae bacterium]
MSTVRNVAVLVGSLRRESFNRKVAQALTVLAPASLKLTIAEIGQLPFFNEDEEVSPPPTWTAFRQLIKAADAVLFVTPEYNRSIPGVLKNAIDVASRPYGKNNWDGKPGAVISVSPGAIGGFGANNNLRQSLAMLNVPAMPAPEMYIGRVESLINAEGDLDDNTQQFLQKFAQAFAAWIEKNR